VKVGLKVIPYNHALRSTRIAAGLTQKALAELVFVTPAKIGNVERMLCRVPPELALDIALALEADQYELFPPEVRERGFAWNKRTGTSYFVMEVESLDQLPEGDLGMLVEGPEEAYSLVELKDCIGQTLSQLGRREREVIEARFGFGGSEPQTLEEVAREFGVTRERIRQIEMRGLRRLRHPNYSKQLRAFIPGLAEDPLITEEEHDTVTQGNNRTTRQAHAAAGRVQGRQESVRRGH